MLDRDARVFYYPPYLFLLTINDESGNKLYPFALQKGGWFLLVPADTDEDDADIGIIRFLNDLYERGEVLPTIGAPATEENLNGQGLIIRVDILYCFGVRLIKHSAGFIPLQPFQELFHRYFAQQNLLVVGHDTATADIEYHGR